MQKPPDLDAAGNPILDEGKPPDLDHEGNPIETQDIPVKKVEAAPKPETDKTDTNVEKTTESEKPGILSRIWNKVSEPLYEGPSRFAESVSRYIDPNHGSTGARSALSAFIESLGHVGSSLTSPLNLALTAATGGAGLLDESLPAVASALRTGGRALSVPVAAEGATHVFGPNRSLTERLQGIPEHAGGILGMRAHVPDMAASPEIPGPIEPTDARLADLFKDEVPVNQVNRAPEPVVDASGREIAPPQNDVIAPRPTGPWDQNIPNNTPKATPLSEDDLYREATRRFGMGLPKEDVKAEFAFHWPEIGDQYTIRGGPNDLSTVGIDRLKELGIPIPEKNVPPDIPPDILNEFPDLAKNEPELSAPTQAGIPRFGSKTGIEKIKDAQFNPNTGELFDEPSFAKVGNKLAIGADVKSLGKVLGSSLYQGNIGTIATKELIQNSLDAIRHLDESGHVKVHLDEPNGMIHVEDNGKGLTKSELETVFTDLGSSGKRTDENAIGGFGLAKAAPLLGGEHVEVTSIARDGGKLIKSTFKGSPDDLLSGVDIHQEEVPTGTPTGMKVSVKVPQKADFWDADKFVNNIGQYSDFKGKLSHLYRTKYTDSDALPKVISKQSDLSHIATIEGPSSNVTLLQPKDANLASRAMTTLHLRNKGMYQGSISKYFNHEVPNIPADIIADVNPKVPEGHTDYPFTANREKLRGTAEKDLEDYIQKEIVNPALGKRKAAIQEAYDSMPEFKTSSGNKVFIHDTGSRFTPEELYQVMNTPVMKYLGDDIHRITKDILNTWPKAPKNLDKVGFVFDENLRGVNIPNPETGNRSVLINPLQIISNNTPDQAAAGIVHVILHEMAHLEQGGHNESFTVLLSDLYEKYGAENAVREQQKIKGTISNGTGTNRQYTSEIQNLLRKYQEARGRADVKSDALTGTGIGSEITRKGQTGISSDVTNNGKGTNLNEGPNNTEISNSSKVSDNGPQPNEIYLNKPDANVVKLMVNQGYEYGGITEDGKIKMVRTQGPPNKPPIGGGGGNNGELPKPQPEKKASIPREIYEMSRQLMSVDLPFTTSAAFRQASPLTGTKSWFKAWGASTKSYGSQAAYDSIMNRIENDPLVKPDTRWANSKTPRTARSFLTDVMGVKLTDLTKLSNREEFTRGRLAEKIPVYGAHIRGSNRAYTAFLNDVRLNTAKQLLKDAAAQGRDPYTDHALARGIGEFINDATGRGSLKTSVGLGSASVDINLEKSSKLLSDVFFSPRLQAARIRMLNPQTYIMADPFVRKQYLYGMLRSIGAWGSLATLAKLGGGQVSTDPNNADFGKIRIGNTRIDPGAGFQQYLVLDHRMLPRSMGGGGITSSTSGKFTLFGKGYKPDTRTSTAMDFAASKLHPELRFAYDLLNASQKRPFNVGDRLVQMAAPMVASDIMDLVQQDPTIGSLIGIPLAGTTGMGVQTYEGGAQKPTFVPKNWDYQIR